MTGVREGVSTDLLELTGFSVALHLERKRVLRPKGRVGSDGFQVYRHPKKDCEYRVAAVELRPKLIQQIEDQLDFMLI